MTTINNSPPMHCEADAQVNRQLCEQLHQTETYGVGFASDAGTLQTLGISCVLCGPGDMIQAHRPNEYIELRDWEAGGAWLDSLLQRWCYDV